MVLDQNQYEACRKRICEEYKLPHGLPTIDLLYLFPHFRETVAPYSYLEGTSLPTDQALLKSLARRYEKCSYLEIGTWRGESIANVAQVAQRCVSVSLSDREMRQMKISEDFIRAHYVFCRDYDNIEYIKCNSRKYDFMPYKGAIDLVFVDGDHNYKGVLADTRTAFSLLKNDESVIVWHDYGLTTEQVRWSVLCAILDGSDEAEHGYLYHVSNTLCAVYMKKKVPSQFIHFPQLPDKVFSLDIQAEKLIK